MPIFHRNVFDNNFALYGENIASYPVKLSFFNSSTRILLDDSSAINISDLAPGQTIKQNLTVALEDHYGVIIKSDNTSFAEVLSTTLDTVVTGTVTIQAIEGIFIFNDFSVSAKPGTETNIEIYTSAIDPSKAGKARDNSTYYQAILITAKLRYCGIGEVTVGNNCEVCKSGFYSLNPLLATCINCPDQAICFGGYELVPKAGY